MKFLSYLPPLKVRLSPQGRLNRLQYFASWIVLSVAALIAAMTLYQLFQPGDGVSSLAIVGFVIAVVPLSFIVFFLHAKRLHDLGLPAVIGLAVVAGPIAVSVLSLLDMIHAIPDWLLTIRDVSKELGRDIGIGFGSYLLLAPGQPGDNRYGPAPSTGRS